MIFPRRFTVAAEYGNNLVYGDFRASCAVPACNGVQWRDKSAFYRDFFKLCKMLRVIHKFVFKLYGDNVSAVLIEKSLNLLINLTVPNSYKVKIFIVIFAQLKRLFQKPVGEASVSALTVRPRTNSDYNVKTDVGAFLYKASHVVVTRKIKFTLDFLMVNHKQICRDNRYTARFHFCKLRVPLISFTSRKVKFAHNSDKRLTVFRKILACYINFLTQRIFAAQIKMIFKERRR